MKQLCMYCSKKATKTRQFICLFNNDIKKIEIDICKKHIKKAGKAIDIALQKYKEQNNENK